MLHLNVQMGAWFIFGGIGIFLSCLFFALAPKEAPKKGPLRVILAISSFLLSIVWIMFIADEVGKRS